MSKAAAPSHLLRTFLVPVFLYLFASALPANAQGNPIPTWSYTPLQSALAAPSSGDGYVPLMTASDGNFYGISGTSGSIASSIFRMDTLGNVTIVYSFPSSSSAGGPPAGPVGSLVQGTDGFLYGFTIHGGVNGDGAFYKVQLDGTNFTSLYSFTESTDSGAPVGGLTLGTDGNFYAVALGETYEAAQPVRHGPNTRGPAKQAQSQSNPRAHRDGGSVYSCPENTQSALYQYTPSGQATAIYCSTGSDGLVSASEAPVLGADGNFYILGAWISNLLQIVPSSNSLNSIPVSLPNSNFPFGNLIGGSDGKLYFTGENGSLGDCGSMFSLDPSNSYSSSLIGAFDCTEAEFSNDHLYLGSDSAVYGTSLGNTNNNDGSVFRVDTSGAISYLYDFVSGTGVQPRAAPVQAGDGNFYGLTQSSTTYDGAGLSYSLDPSTPLAAPVTLTSNVGQTIVNNAFSLTWAVNNASPFAPPVCVALINNAAGTDGWSGILTGTFTGGVFGGSVAVTPTTGGTDPVYQIVCNGQGSASTSVWIAEPTPTRTALLIGPASSMASGTMASLTATVSRNSDCGAANHSGQCVVGRGHTDSPELPSGTVTFSWNGSPIGQPVNLSRGVATLQVDTVNLAAQSYSVTATYSGSDDFAVSSDTETGTLTTIPTTTAVILAGAGAANTGSLTAGHTANLAAHVTDNSGSGTPTGTITFYSGSVFLGDASLNDAGVALLTLSSTDVPAGAYAVTAVYSGNRTHDASTSNAMTVEVDKAATITTVSATNSRIAPGGSDHFTATVTASGTHPGGRVHFLWNNYLICVANLISGSGTCTGTAPANSSPGQYSVTAAYMGDRSDRSSISQPITVNVGVAIP